MSYTKGYWYDAVTAGWKQYAGTCTGALSGDWHRKLSVLVPGLRLGNDHGRECLDRFINQPDLPRRDDLQCAGRELEMRVPGYDVQQFLLADTGGGDVILLMRMGRGE